MFMLEVPELALPFLGTVKIHEDYRTMETESEGGRLPAGRHADSQRHLVQPLGCGIAHDLGFLVSSKSREDFPVIGSSAGVVNREAISERSLASGGPGPPNGSG